MLRRQVQLLSLGPGILCLQPAASWSRRVFRLHFTRVVRALEGIPLRLVSQADARRNVTLVIDGDDLPNAMGRLHAEFFSGAQSPEPRSQRPEPKAQSPGPDDQSPGRPSCGILQP